MKADEEEEEEEDVPRQTKHGESSNILFPKFQLGYAETLLQASGRKTEKIRSCFHRPGRPTRLTYKQ